MPPLIPKISGRASVTHVLNSINNLETKPQAKLEFSPAARSPNVKCCMASEKDAIKKEEDTPKHTSALKELFVFGRPQSDSVFKFSHILGGVGSTMKRLFGFKS